jgi:phage terminase small subunit
LRHAEKSFRPDGVVRRTAALAHLIDLHQSEGARSKMPALPNARHERFAQAIADGQTAGEAYLAAGYSCRPHKTRGHGHRLRTRGDIQTRITELPRMRERAAEEGLERAIAQTAITKTWVIAKLRLNAERALQARPVLDKDGNPTGQYRYEGAVANRALELLGRSLGMFIERTEQGKPGDFEHLSDEELDAALAEKLTARGMTPEQVERFLNRSGVPQPPTAA